MTARTMSLRLQLFLLIVTPLLVASVLLGFWRFNVAQTTAEALFDRGLLAAALAISRDVEISEGDALSPRTRDLISDAGGGEVFYHVTGPGGIYVTGYAYPPAQSNPVQDAPPQYTFASYRGEEVRVLRMSETTTIGNLTGATVVTVWHRMSDRSAFAAALARRAAALIAALMATLVVVVWFGVELGLRPLKGLQDAIQKRSPNDLSRIQRPVPAEVSGIVETLNRLFGQVERNIQAHQAFISDAAHQLRNPASALLSLAETLPDVQDPQERGKRQQELIRAARKSARLAEQLLSMERLRYGEQGLDTPFELNDLAQTVCADLGPEVLRRDLAFIFEPCAQDLPVRGDPVLMGEAVGNLIDNALRHGGASLGRISVSTGLRDGKALLSVSDDGCGLRPEASERAFQRFGQLSPSDGSGLGLAIVKEVVTAHGGSVSVDRVAQGTRLTLTLQLAQNAEEPATGA